MGADPALHVGSRVYIPLAVRQGGVRLSALMPFTWLAQVPGLSAFREPGRFTLLGLGAGRPAGGRRSGRAGGPRPAGRGCAGWLAVLAVLALAGVGWAGAGWAGPALRQEHAGRHARC